VVELNYKTLIILRHAHRDISNRNLDNGISDKGRHQAKRSSDFFEKRYQEHWPLLLSSSRKRCLETLTPLAKRFDLRIQENARLLEQLPSEDHATFVSRIHQFFEWWLQEQEMLMVICTHGDWISVAMEYLFNMRGNFKKGCWVELQAKENKISLTWLIQSFKHF
jgi:broad specificity phosphatase PhoE